MGRRHQGRVSVIPVPQIRGTFDNRVPQISGVPVWRRVRQR